RVPEGPAGVHLRTSGGGRVRARAAGAARAGPSGRGAAGAGGRASARGAARAGGRGFARGAHELALLRVQLGVHADHLGRLQEAEPEGVRPAPGSGGTGHDRSAGRAGAAVDPADGARVRAALPVHPERAGVHRAADRGGVPGGRVLGPGERARRAGRADRRLRARHGPAGRRSDGRGADRLAARLRGDQLPALRGEPVRGVCDDPRPRQLHRAAAAAEAGRRPDVPDACASGRRAGRTALARAGHRAQRRTRGAGGAGLAVLLERGALSAEGLTRAAARREAGGRARGRPGRDPWGEGPTMQGAHGRKRSDARRGELGAPLWLLLVLAGCAAGGDADPGANADAGPRADAAAPAPQGRWWKGNLHTHSLWSDGDDYPEMIVNVYRNADYHFLAISDHNVLPEAERWVTVPPGGKAARAYARYLERFGRDWVVAERLGGDTLRVRLKTLAEYRPLFEEPGRFMLIQSEEISDRF